MKFMGTMAKDSPKRGVFRTVVIGLGVCLLGAIGAAGGCVQQPTQLQPLGSSSGESSSGTTTGGGAGNPAREAFASMTLLVWRIRLFWLVQIDINRS
jgi:hypothetical protein